jgi:hypothetical protein
MPDPRPVAQSTAVHVLLIDTFTHSGFQPVGQTIGLCEYAYAVRCSTALSGDNRNMPAGRKPEGVIEVTSCALALPVSCWPVETGTFERGLTCVKECLYRLYRGWVGFGSSVHGY